MRDENNEQSRNKRNGISAFVFITGELWLREGEELHKGSGLKNDSADNGEYSDLFREDWQGV